MDCACGVTPQTVALESEIDLEGDADARVNLEDKVWVIPADVGTFANVHEYIHVIQNGRLEVVWDVAARTKYR